MGPCIYRGLTLDEANESEFPDRVIRGAEYDIYYGRLEGQKPDATIARLTPVEELSWWDDGGRVDDPILRKTQGITGGMTHTIGTAIGFSGDIPIVLCLDESALNGSAMPVDYRRSWFDSVEGALAWVQGGQISGEVRTEDEGLIGLTTDTEFGPAVWEWGRDRVRATSMQYYGEHESIVRSSSVDIEGALMDVVTYLESQRSPKQVLSLFEKYTASPRYEDGIDISEWSDEEIMRALYQSIRDRANDPLENYWLVVLDSVIMDDVWQIPRDTFVRAYDGSSFYTDPDDIPPHLLGR